MKKRKIASPELEECNQDSSENSLLVTMEPDSVPLEPLFPEIASYMTVDIRKNSPELEECIASFQQFDLLLTQLQNMIQEKMIAIKMPNTTLRQQYIYQFFKNRVLYYASNYLERFSKESNNKNPAFPEIQIFSQAIYKEYRSAAETIVRECNDYQMKIAQSIALQALKIDMKEQEEWIASKKAIFLQREYKTDLSETMTDDSLLRYINVQAIQTTIHIHSIANLIEQFDQSAICNITHFISSLFSHLIVFVKLELFKDNLVANFTKLKVELQTTTQKKYQTSNQLHGNMPFRAFSTNTIPTNISDGSYQTINGFSEKRIK